MAWRGKSVEGMVMLMRPWSVVQVQGDGGWWPGSERRQGAVVVQAGGGVEVPEARVSQSSSSATPPCCLHVRHRSRHGSCRSLPYSYRLIALPRLHTTTWEDRDREERWRGMRELCHGDGGRDMGGLDRRTPPPHGSGCVPATHASIALLRPNLSNAKSFPGCSGRCSSLSHMLHVPCGHDFASVSSALKLPSLP